MKFGPDSEILVCASASMAFTIPGSIFHRKCIECKTAVQIAPSGQLFLKTNPHVAILCLRCCSALPADLTTDTRWAAPEHEIRQEIARALPNVWRNRN